jgi:CBS domain-containing protein
MELSEIATRVVSIRPDSTVLEACDLMVAERIGAMVVLDEGKLVGILSERDIVGRVVVKRRDPEKTRVSEVMTAKVRTIAEGTSSDDALDLMHEGRFRHLPLVNAQGQVIGMLSMRHLLRERVGELSLRNADLVGFIAADGPGG